MRYKHKNTFKKNLNVIKFVSSLTALGRHRRSSHSRCKLCRLNDLSFLRLVIANAKFIKSRKKQRYS